MWSVPLLITFWSARKIGTWFWQKGYGRTQAHCLPRTTTRSLWTSNLPRCPLRLGGRRVGVSIPLFPGGCSESRISAPIPLPPACEGASREIRLCRGMNMPASSWQGAACSVTLYCGVQVNITTVAMHSGNDSSFIPCRSPISVLGITGYEDLSAIESSN